MFPLHNLQVFMERWARHLHHRHHGSYKRVSKKKINLSMNRGERGDQPGKMREYTYIKTCRCSLVHTLVFLLIPLFFLPIHLSFFLCVCGGVGMHVSLSLQPHLKLLQSLIRCMSSHLFCFHTSSTLKWNSAPVPTLKHIRGKAYCIFMNSIEGGWSRHNDRAGEGRNGASKLVSDWE